MTTFHPEALVVGGGPAGSSLALRLARRGRRVRLLDAAAFPRSKPCGDCLSPGATPILRELGVLGAVEARRPGRLLGWRLRTPGGVWFGGRFSPHRGTAPPVGYALPREELDHILLSAAVDQGVEFLPRRRVFRLLWNDGRVRGVVARNRSGATEEHRAGLVIGADGLRSAVARRLGPVRRGSTPRLALVRRYAGLPGPAGRGEMRIGAAGCLGYAPLGRARVNVTLVVHARRAPEISADREEFLRGALEAYGIAGQLEGARPTGPVQITGPFELSPTRITAPGALLVGDAAGYFDPFTGQGIFRALAGARLAAECADRILAGPPVAGRPGCSRGTRETRLLGLYERRLGQMLRPAVRVQRLVDRVMSRAALAEAAGQLLRRRPGLASLLVDVAGDRVPAGALARPAAVLRALAGHSAEESRPGAGGLPATEKTEEAA